LKTKGQKIVIQNPTTPVVTLPVATLHPYSPTPIKQPEVLRTPLSMHHTPLHARHPREEPPSPFSPMLKNRFANING
jgi:hypothetical protein